MYIYMSDNICLMRNKSPWVAGVPSSWKPVLCGRLERYCAIVVPLNGCDLVLLWVSFPKWGILFCEQVERMNKLLVCSQNRIPHFGKLTHKKTRSHPLRGTTITQRCSGLPHNTGFHKHDTPATHGLLFLIR